MKRIIAVMAALMFVAVLFNINVSADTSSVDGGITSGGGGRGGSRTEYGNGLNVFFETLEDFTDGNITYDEFNSKTSTILEEYAGEFSDRAGITLINDIKSQVNDYVTKYGTNAPMYIYDSISDILNSYETTETIPTTDKKGYGAKLVERQSDGTYREVYCDYIVIDGTTYNFYSDVDDKTIFIYYDAYGNEKYRVPYSAWSSINDLGWIYELYGDVRYYDGTQAPTDDEYIEQPTYDFSNATDSELDELLQELKEELERQNPDLSTMEGLLESIYYRLGSLDSDNDNALLSEINAAIISLAKDGQSQNSELISKLDELKDALGGGEASETDLTEITEELKEISKKLGHLCNTEIAENALELTEEEQKLFDEWANLIPLLVDKVGLAVVTQTMHDIETVIFTTSAPSDLTFTLFDETYVLLSTETFSDENVMLSVNNIKTFISVILVYVWCIRMRRLLI